MDLEQARTGRLAIKEWDRAKDVYFTLKLDVTQAMGLLGTINLALNHPQNCGPTAELMRQLAFQLEEKLSFMGPATRKLCELGRSPAPETAPCKLMTQE